MEKNNSLDFLFRSQELQVDPQIEGSFFLIDLDKVSEKEAINATKYVDYSILQKAEKKRLLKDQIKIIITHAILKKMLAERLNRSHTSIKLIYNETGKPHFKDYPLHFSLSYGEKYSVLAFHTKYPIGIDIEHLRAHLKLIEMAKLFMHTSEIKQMHLSDDMSSYFFALWSLKEAFLKANEIHFDDLSKYDLSMKLNENQIFLKNSPEQSLYVHQGIVPHHSLGICISKLRLTPL